MSGYRKVWRRGSFSGYALGLIAVLGLMAMVTSTEAQTQTPLTSQVQSEAQAQAQAQLNAQVPTVAVARHVTLIGDATQSLLALQRSGQLAAPAQPMLGAEASAAYARYLKSFDHPIPEHLDSSVGTVGSAAGNGAPN